LVDVLGITDMGAAGTGRIAYHACCHGLRELGIDHQPRALLDSVEGIERVEMREETECCGFGGLFAVKNAPISEAMGRRKTQNIVDSGADVVALCDVSCMTHINGLLSRQKQSARAVHIAQVLAGETAAAHSASNLPSPSAPTTPKAEPKNAEPPPRRWQDVR
jgi:L-lactate dehydrogenase complex protein LldE